MSMPLATFGNLFGPAYLVIVLAVMIFWLWMLIDCINNKALRDTDKIIWVLVILLAQIIGAVLYFFIVRGARKNPPGLR